MMQVISGDYWVHYKSNKAEARVYTREVIFGPPISQNFIVRSFDAATGVAKLSDAGGWTTFLRTVKFTEIKHVLLHGKPQKVLQYGGYTMPMKRQFTDPEPPSNLIFLLVMAGAILLLLSVL